MGFNSVVYMLAVLVCWVSSAKIHPSVKDVQLSRRAEYIHICKRNDPHVSKCIRESIEVIKPKLKYGIPEILVPGLEPLFIKEIEISRGNDASQFKAYLRNINVYGASEFQVTKLKVNVEKGTYRFGVKIPVLRLEGEYDVDARLLLVPIKGHGKFVANATKCEGQGILSSEIEVKEGRKYFKFTKLDLLIRIDDYNIHLDNLFDGDKVLSQAANEVLNSNKQEFIPRTIPFIQRKVSEILLEVANQITQSLDYDEVFPEK